MTAQTPAGMPVPVTGGGDSSRSHWPWLVSRQKGRRVVVEVPKDRAWMERDARAALAVEGLTRPRSYAEQLELEPVKRRLKIPGVDPDVESAEEKWRRAGPRLGELDTPDLDPDEEKTTIVIPEGETRDYYVSQYDAGGSWWGGIASGTSPREPPLPWWGRASPATAACPISSSFDASADCARRR